MYSFDYLNDIRKLEAFLYDGPEHVEQTFGRDEFGQNLLFKKRSSNSWDKIQQMSDELFESTSDRISVDFTDDLEIIVSNLKNIT
jgi:hypothetical protein